MRQSNKGFTLVELLIVVAIMGILSAIAIPQFVKYRAHAAVRHAESDLSTCMVEATAQEIINGLQALNCTDLKGNLLTCMVTIHVGNGSVSLTSPCPVTYEHFALTCAMMNNVGSCHY